MCFYGRLFTMYLHVAVLTGCVNHDYISYILSYDASLMPYIGIGSVWSSGDAEAAADAVPEGEAGAEVAEGAAEAPAEGDAPAVEAEAGEQAAATEEGEQAEGGEQPPADGEQAPAEGGEQAAEEQEPVPQVGIIRLHVYCTRHVLASRHHFVSQ